MKTRLFTLVLSILLCSGCTAYRSTSPSWLDGKWEGIGYQLDLQEDPTWSILLSIDTKQKAYSIRYPSLQCTGQWQLIKGTKERVVFQEIIDENTAACTEKGIVIITKVDANHISYSYYVENQATVAAFSTLHRK